MRITRRAFGLSTVALVVSGHASWASEPTIVVAKDPYCDCCTGWVEHLRAAGFQVQVQNTAELAGVKARHGIPADLGACHTAVVGGYVIEGHVPALAIRRLLKERPKAKGLAVPGMPVGSPGMEVPGTIPEEYEVILFGSGRRTYARFKGVTELP